MIRFAMATSNKLKLPEIRLLTLAEQQQLTDLANNMAAAEAPGPDWKERQSTRQSRKQTLERPDAV
jgi:hypothetical protein